MQQSNGDGNGTGSGGGGGTKVTNSVTLLISSIGNFPCSFSWDYWESVALLPGDNKMSIPSDRNFPSDFSILITRNAI